MCWLVSVFPFLTTKQWGYKIYQLNLANSCTLLKTYKIHKNEIENNRNDYSLGQKLGHNGHNRCSAKCDVAPKIWNWVDAVRQCIQCNNNCWEFTRHKNNNCHRSGLFKPHERMTWDREKRSKKKCPTEHSIRYLFMKCRIMRKIPCKISIREKPGFSRIQNFGKFGLNIFHHLYALYVPKILLYFSATM